MKHNKKMIISIIIFIIPMMLLGFYLYDYSIKKHQPVKIKTNKLLEEDHRQKEIQELHTENNDLYGWIRIEDTNIDYPVMYTENKNYYLRKDFYKNYYKAGSIFIDKNNKIEPRDINLIIHGHNMKDGKMFFELTNYKKASFYKTHKNIILYTLNGKEEYEIISVFTSQIYKKTDDEFKYYKYYNIDTEERYNDYIKNIKEKSLYNINITATYPEELITLSTCEYSKKNGRMVVVAKRIDN